jgi:hypothetical protein
MFYDRKLIHVVSLNKMHWGECVPNSSLYLVFLIVVTSRITFPKKLNDFEISERLLPCQVESSSVLCNLVCYIKN